MDFLKILQSLEELLYQAMTWLLFYPRTMWRVVRHPMQMLNYSDEELRDKPDQQYTDALSPPLFLMITILLSHVIELMAHQHLPRPTTSIGQQVAASEQNLLIVRSMMFAIYPLMFASARLKRERMTVNRDTLRGPFFAQCYIAAPAALLMGVAAVLARTHLVQVQLLGLALSLASATWYIWVETHWFKTHPPQKIGAAFRLAFATWFKATLLSALISAFILGNGG